MGISQRMHGEISSTKNALQHQEEDDQHILLRSALVTLITNTSATGDSNTQFAALQEQIYEVTLADILYPLRALHEEFFRAGHGRFSHYLIENIRIGLCGSAETGEVTLLNINNRVKSIRDAISHFHIIVFKTDFPYNELMREIISAHYKQEQWTNHCSVNLNELLQNNFEEKVWRSLQSIDFHSNILADASSMEEECLQKMRTLNRIEVNFIQEALFKFIANPSNSAFVSNWAIRNFQYLSWVLPQDCF